MKVREYPRLNPIIAELVREECETRGWDAEQFAKSLNSSTLYAERMLAGVVKFRPVTAFRLAQAFGTSAEFFENLQTSKGTGHENSNPNRVIQNQFQEGHPFYPKRVTA